MESKAQHHFRQRAKSARARAADAAGKKSGQLLTPSDKRYFEEGGIERYDVKGVDDGSSKARSVAYTGLPYRAPKRPQGWWTPMLRTFTTRGRQIGHGQQSTVWEYKRRVLKLFQVPFTPIAFKQNLNFLLENAKSGVVPRVISHNAEYGWIKMMPLHGYNALQRSDLRHKSKRYREELLQVIARARAKLPHDVEYSDLQKLDNIAVLHHPKTGAPTRVKFYEGGTASKYHDSLRAQQYVLEMAKKLGVSNMPFARRVKALSRDM